MQLRNVLEADVTVLQHSRCRLLGIDITPITIDALIRLIDLALSSSRGLVIVGHNLHSSYLYYSEKEFREFYSKASVILADGAPVYWDHLLTGKRIKCSRIGSTDWIPEVGRLRNLGRIAVVGSSDEANSMCVEVIGCLVPGLEIIGLPGSDWNAVRADRPLEVLAKTEPDLVLIGLGMPLQEVFASQVVSVIPRAVVATVGGAIDQLAGIQRNAPRWTGRFGVEWLYRLVTQPRRLWRRYLLEPWRLAWIRGRWLFRGYRTASTTSGT